MTRRDLSSLFDDGLTYPDVPSALHPEGKTYRVESPDAKTGLWLVSLSEISMGVAEPTDEALKLDDDEEKTLYQRVLGATFDEMIADGVRWGLLRQVAQDAFLYYAVNPQAADSALVALGEAAARDKRATETTPSDTSSTPNTTPPTDGLNSDPASTPTKAPTRRKPATTRGSGRSSTSPKPPRAGSTKQTAAATA